MFRASYKAFTIIELLVVIVVIGIIAAVSIVAYNGVQARARDVANDSNITNILKIAELHRAQEDVYPGMYYGEENGMNRWDTAVDTESSVYRNPAAPEWLTTGSFVLNSEHTWHEDDQTIHEPDFDHWNNICFPSYACQEDGTREVKKEWMYFIDPLVDNGAGSTVCSDVDPTRYWDNVTGFRIRYYNETSKSWIEKRTGSGEIGKFITCAM